MNVKQQYEAAKAIKKVGNIKKSVTDKVKDAGSSKKTEDKEKDKDIKEEPKVEK